MILPRLMLSLCLGILAGCATPVEVKQALTLKDQQYTENMKLMEQYRVLDETISARQTLWSRYLKNRSLLSVALAWATTNPSGTPGASKRILGDEIVGWVNDHRLKGLGSREEVFLEGKGELTTIIRDLPTLIALVPSRVRELEEEDKKELNTQLNTELRAGDEPGPYDVYRTNISALRQINVAIKQYLDIDLTVRREDVKEIADAVRALR
ncbi:MAG TPA: hypothetical protein VJ692_08445 [Nitrospiraceae bacterium]|nr:hypothetical protein [Nitrospiraceae bacterium]